MLNEILFLQVLTLILLFFFLITYNILTLWYIAGLYLISAGIILLLDDGDIFIGFLWVIDLGVGLIFFIFILHFLSFLHQKTLFNLSNKFIFIYFYLFLFILIYFYLFINPIDFNFNNEIKKSWFFFISWYDYYNIFYVRTVTELNLIRELYFYNNSFEFFLINYVVFYGIILSIILTFLIKRVFNYIYLPFYKNLFLYNEINSSYFIRNQNFLKQQNTSIGTRVWKKNSSYKI